MSSIDDHLEEKSLVDWLNVNSQPAGFMHEDWWKYVGCVSMKPLYEKGRMFENEINFHLMQVLGLQPLPFAAGIQCKNTFFYWIEHFLLLKPMAMLLGLFLTENPSTVLLKGAVYRKAATFFPREKIQPLLVNYSLVAGNVRKFFRCDDSSFDTFGARLLVGVAPDKLATRVRLLFSPHDFRENRSRDVYGQEQCLLVQQLVKRLFRLAGLKNMLKEAQ